MQNVESTADPGKPGREQAKNQQVQIQMIVYSISATAAPQESNFPHFAPLVTSSDDDSRWLGNDEFQGKPFTRKWRTLSLTRSMPLLPLADFSNFGVGKFVCNERARIAADESLEMCGELLPVKVNDVRGKFYLFNVTNCIDAIDSRRSKWEQLAPGVRILERPAFCAERVGELNIFKIPEDAGVNIYCIERSGDPEDGEFKAVVEHHSLTGLVFEEVWRDRKRKRPL